MRDSLLLGSRKLSPPTANWWAFLFQIILYICQTKTHTQMSRQDKIDRIKATELILWYFALLIVLFFILPLWIFKAGIALIILTHAALGIYIYLDLKRTRND